MKVVFTGGGTGGHVFPLLAVAEALRDLVKDKALSEFKMYYFSTDPYSVDDLTELGIEFRQIMAGKRRIYASSKNIFDTFKMGLGILQAIWKLFLVYPDVVFAKGGYASFPTIVAAWVLRIPIIIHESDTVPGRVNMIARKMAYRIAVSYAEAVEFFPKEKTAHTGQPIRRSVATPIRGAGYEYMGLRDDLPVLGIFGGSQGAKAINDAVMSVLPELVKYFQIVHQTGKDHFDEMEKTAKLALLDSEYAVRYHPYPFLDALAYQMVGGVSKLVITRAGSSLFEFAAWGVPAVVIPIEKSNGNHQKRNAYAYARAGAGIVIEEPNLTPHILLAEITRIMQNDGMYQNMKQAAASFYRPGAAEQIAQELLRISLGHEKVT